MEQKHYTYNKPSLVNAVTVITDESGGKRAFLHANQDASLSDLQKIRTELADKDLLCLPNSINNTPVLEVRGFTKNEQVLSRLRANRWTQGEADIKTDEEKPSTFIDQIKKRSLQLSGVFMALADLGFIGYGIKEKKWEDVSAGMAYLTGSSVMSLFGRLDQSDIRIRDIAKMIVDYGESKGLDMSNPNAASNAIDKKPQTVMRKAHNLLRNYPSEIGNMSYVVAGSMIAKSALQHKAFGHIRPDMTAEQIHHMHKEGWQDSALGGCTIASGLIATFMKEKQTDPDKPLQGGLSGMFDWMKNHPLAVASYGYMGSTICHAFSTYTAHKDAKITVNNPLATAAERSIAAERLSSVKFRAAFVAFTIIGEIFLSISSKGHGDGVIHDNSIKESVIALAADMIGKQPQDQQQEIIHHMAGYLGSPKVLAIGDAEAEKCLREKLECIQNNPWAQPVDDKVNTRKKEADFTLAV